MKVKWSTILMNHITQTHAYDKRSIKKHITETNEHLGHDLGQA